MRNRPYCPHHGIWGGTVRQHTAWTVVQGWVRAENLLCRRLLLESHLILLSFWNQEPEHNFCSRSLHVKWLHLHLTRSMKKTLTNANQVTLANWTCWVIANPSRFLCAILKTAQLLSWLNHFFVRTSFLCINRFTRNDSWGNTLCWLNFYPWRLHFPFLCIFD